jgi:hypothetical protein
MFTRRGRNERNHGKQATIRRILPHPFTAAMLSGIVAMQTSAAGQLDNSLRTDVRSLSQFTNDLSGIRPGSFAVPEARILLPLG